MVAMNRMMSAWLIRGRRIRRSISMASTIITTTVAISASHTGAPRSISPTRVSAANSTMTPWAKLNTPEALKIRTKPSATSEYITPVRTPPTTTSMKNTGAVAISTKGVTKMPARKSIGERPYP